MFILCNADDGWYGVPPHWYSRYERLHLRQSVLQAATQEKSIDISLSSAHSCATWFRRNLGSLAQSCFETFLFGSLDPVSGDAQ